MDKTLGFIGLGIMGKHMAINLINAGYKLVVLDINPGPVEELVAMEYKRRELKNKVTDGGSLWVRN